MGSEHGSGMENHSGQQFTADSSLNSAFKDDSHKNDSNGSSMHTERLEKALDVLTGKKAADQNQNQQSGNNTHQKDVADSLESNSQNHDDKSGNQNKSGQKADAGGSEFNHISPDQLDNPKTLDPTKVQQEKNLAGRLGDKGDILDGGGGNNTVIGAGGNDIILGNTEGAFNTITTGTGKDLVVLGKEVTNRVFDFNPKDDQFGLDGFKVDDITFGQGKNPTPGGLDQPLDSKNNTVVVDKTTDHILASLTFTKAGDLSEKNFVTVKPEDLKDLKA